MKKYLYFMSFALMLFCFASCSCDDIATLATVDNNELSIDNPNKKAFDDLKKQVEKFGEKARMDAHNANPSTRGSIWKFFKKVINTIKADCLIGMIVSDITHDYYSAAVGGIVGSVAYYVITKGETSIMLAPAPNGYVPTNPDSISREEVMANLVFNINGNPTSFIDSVGYIHNAVILDMYDSNPQLFTRESLFQREYVDSINVSIQKVLSYNPNIAISEELSDSVRNVFDNYMSFIIENDSIDAYTDSICNTNEVVAEEWEIAETFMETLSNLESNSTTQIMFTRQVLEAIDESSLPNQIKATLTIGVLIANASDRLWNSRLLQ